MMHLRDDNEHINIITVAYPITKLCTLFSIKSTNTNRKAEI